MNFLKEGRTAVFSRFFIKIYFVKLQYNEVKYFLEKLML